MRPIRRPGQEMLEALDPRSDGERPPIQHFINDVTVLVFDTGGRQRNLDTTHITQLLARAGTPITVAPAATSRVTTAPAPTTAKAPTRKPARTTAPAPICAPSPMMTRPASTDPGDRCTKSPTSQSWSTMAPVLTTDARPT